MLTEQQLRIEVGNLEAQYRELAAAALRVWIAALKVDKGTLYHRVSDMALAELRRVLDKQGVP